MKPLVASTILVCLIGSPCVTHAQEPTAKPISISSGCTLHFVDEGVGEPVIFVHGLASDYSFWMRQTEAFSKKGYRAISYSRRYNFPNTNKLRPNHSALVEANDLAALIRELDLENAHIVGHSFGAYTALLLAIRHPELVNTLTLAEPPLVPWLNEISGPQAEDGKAHLAKLSEALRAAERTFDSDDGEQAMKSVLDCLGGSGTFDGLPGFVKAKCMRNINELQAIVTSEAPYPPIDREQIRRLKVPTLILSGSQSVATASFTDPELERLLPRPSRRRVVIDEASHIMWVEQPVRCREAVLSFMRDMSDK